MPARTEGQRPVRIIALVLAWAIQPVWAAADEVPRSTPNLQPPRAVHDVGVLPTVASPDAMGATTEGAVGLKPESSSFRLRGHTQAEIARTIANPDHWSKMRLRSELTAQGRISDAVNWKLSGRVDYDAVYDVTDFYPAEVRRDQRFNLMARENYIDVTAGNWEIRLGRQQIVWGEVIGLFFADVVSAKDLREFVLPDFDILRVPQWAIRAEYGSDRFHAEVVWIPVPSYDRIGQPGADFFPALPPTPPGFARLLRGQAEPSRTLSNTNYGLRLSTLRNGWDVSGFYYRSMDTAPTFQRQIVFGPQPAAVFEARHDRITQIGSTVAKDFGWTVLKAEGVYTRGRKFNVIRLSDEDGLVPQNILDWIVGLDFNLPGDFRFNVQLFQRLFFNHDPDILLKRRESGYSVYLTRDLTSQLEAQALFIASLERSDWMLRPKLIWKFEKNWRLTTGVDLFHGPPFGLFGQFANRDRAYAEVRYSF
jgi:hypothetical protein